MSDIIQEIRSGNKEVVKSVYQQYAKDVYNFAKSITGDHDTALAATKKTFMTLFKNIQNGEEPANLRTAALKIAYDEAYKLAAPQEEAAAEEAVGTQEAVQEEAPQPAAEAAPAPQGDIYAEPMFQKRSSRYTKRIPVVEQEFEEYEDSSYEEEDDGFVPPQRERDQEREDVYVPKGGYETLIIDSVPVEEEQAAMRRKRQIQFQEDAERQNARRVQRPEPEAEEPAEYNEPEPQPIEDVDVFALNSRGEIVDDYDDLDNGVQEKPRNKGLFVFCIILNIVLILILLWFLGGLLVNLGVLPNIDLGYSWFNAHIYPLF